MKSWDGCGKKWCLVARAVFPRSFFFFFCVNRQLINTTTGMYQCNKRLIYRSYTVVNIELHKYRHIHFKHVGVCMLLVRSFPFRFARKSAELEAARAAAQISELQEAPGWGRCLNGYSMIWCDVIRYDTIWYDVMWYDMIWWYMMHNLQKFGFAYLFLRGPVSTVFCTGQL